MLSLVLDECLSRWVLMNNGLEIKESQDFETHLSLKRDLKGSHMRISNKILGENSREAIICNFFVSLLVYGEAF